MHLANCLGLNSGSTASNKSKTTQNSEPTPLTSTCHMHRGSHYVGDKSISTTPNHPRLLTPFRCDRLADFSSSARPPQEKLTFPQPFIEGFSKGSLCTNCFWHHEWRWKQWISMDGNSWNIISQKSQAPNELRPTVCQTAVRTSGVTQRGQRVTKNGL